MRTYIFSKTPMRLSKYLEEVLPELRFGYFRTLLKQRDVRINGKKVTIDAYLKPGDVIELYLDESKLLKFNYEKVYMDEHILVAVKPRGVSSEDFARRISSTDNITAELAHRLDTNTKGLIMMYLDEVGKQGLDLGFRRGYIVKKYNALVSGKLEEALDLKAYLVKDAERGIVRIYDERTDGAVQIRTEVKPIEYQGDYTIVEVTLHSGKTHQIRAHLAHIGYPIIGDTKYGDFEVNRVARAKRQYLTAVKLGFSFPKNSPMAYLNDMTFETARDF